MTLEVTDIVNAFKDAGFKLTSFNLGERLIIVTWTDDEYYFAPFLKIEDGSNSFLKFTVDSSLEYLQTTLSMLQHTTPVEFFGVEMIGDHQDAA